MNIFAIVQEMRERLNELDATPVEEQESAAIDEYNDLEKLLEFAEKRGY